MTGRRRLGRLTGDRGSFTAELAVGLPALMLLLFAALTGVGAVTTKGQCVDAAREAALAASRGDSGEVAGQRAAPPGAVVEVDLDAEVATARVRAPVRLLGAHLPAITVEATAVAAREPQIIGGPA